MADGTKIEWTDMTWNPINGCSLASPGCTNCYAMKQAHRFPVRQGLTEMTAKGMRWTGEVRFNESVLEQPIRMRRPRRIFVCAHGDLFHERVPDDWIDRVFAVMVLSPQHVFQVLTKRTERMREYLRAFSTGGRFVCDHVSHILAPRSDGGYDTRLAKDQQQLRDALARSGGTPMHPYVLPNVWAGTSVEDQQRADERIPVLLETPAAIRWLSMEPLLGPVDLTTVRACRGCPGCSRSGRSALDRASDCWARRIDWIVLGGESGPNARPMHPDWAVAVQQQCEAAGVPFLFKQWGEFLPDQIGPEDARSTSFPPGHVIFNKVGKKAAGRKLFGVEHNGYPERIEA